MPNSQLDRSLQIVAIALVCLWGCWSLFYWTVVIVFDGTFATLQSMLPVYLALTLASLVLCARKGLTFEPPARAKPTETRRLESSIGGSSIQALCILIVSLTLFGSMWLMGLSASTLPYSLLWVVVCPIALWLSARRGVATTSDHHPGAERVRARRIGIDSVALLLACGAAVTMNVRTHVPTPDDAFNVGSIGSILSNPDLPVQGRDFLLATSAPYTAHPLYRTSAHGTLVASMSELTGIDPLRLYYDLIPPLCAFMWTVVGYLFLRSLLVPHPGLAIAMTLAVLALWVAPKTPGAAFQYIVLGKNMVATMAAPIVFSLTAAFVNAPSIATWSLLFLGVCALAGWSSSAFFVVPIALILAALTYLPSYPRKAALAVSLSFVLVPIVGLSLFTLSQMAMAPVDISSGTGAVISSRHVFGGAGPHSLMLLVAVAMPMVGRALAPVATRAFMTRLALLGMGTVLTPFLIEEISVRSGVNLLSWRLYWCYPLAFLPAIFGSFNLLLFFSGGPGFRRAPYRSAVLIVLSLAWIVAFLDSYDPRHRSRTFSSRHNAFLSENRQRLAHARQVRMLIPDQAFVAAGTMDDILINDNYFCRFSQTRRRSSVSDTTCTTTDCCFPTPNSSRERICTGFSNACRNQQGQPRAETPIGHCRLGNI